MKRKVAGEHRRQIRDHCARWTVPREDIFGLLADTQQHLSPKEIYSRLHASNPDLGLATIYRTLDLLQRASVVAKIHSPDGQVRYEYRRDGPSDHHHHLICTACGLILNYRDFEQEELDLVRRTETILEKKHGFLIRDHNIEFLGLCKKCQAGDALKEEP